MSKRHSSKRSLSVHREKTARDRENANRAKRRSATQSMHLLENCDSEIREDFLLAEPLHEFPKMADAPSAPEVGSRPKRMRHWKTKEWKRRTQARRYRASMAVNI